ncbi:MAG: TonB-dependent receptor [Candidatus Omnitrophica bacterium]|nr:TonB-dependent receptor [Candidatus Omnitrophota bacterium]
MFVLSRVVLVLMGVFCLSSGVYAEESRELTLPEVVVSANREKESMTVATTQKAEETLRQIPGGVDLISQDDYKTGRSTMITDVLGYSPGVFAQQRDTGAQESRVSIRGSGVQRTFHLRGIKLLQDGLPVNDADGSGDFYRVEPLSTEYTEVYRGGNAMRYGSTTLGGAINFVSPTGYDADKLQGRFEGGSFGYIRSQISSGQVLGPADYYVSVSQFKQDGFRDHTQQDNHYEFANVGYKINDEWESRVYANNAVIKAKLGGGLRKSQMLSDPTQANASSVSGNQKRDMEYFRIANKTTYQQDDVRFDFSLFGSKMDMFHPIFQVLDIDTINYGGEILFTNTADWMDKENQLTVGFSPTLVYYTDDRYVNSGGTKGARTAEFDNKAYNLDLYLEDQLKFADRWSLVQGVQLSYADRQITDYFQTNGDDSGNAVYRSINPKAGILYDLTETSQAFFGYSRSYEPPTFSELFNSSGDFLNNKAQRGHTWETGVRGEEGIFGYDATYYYSILDKELLSLSDSLGNPLGTINARGETVHQGIELGGKIDLWEGLLVRDEDKQDKLYTHGVYNWSRFRFDGDPVYGNNQLPSLPEHFVKMELIYEHPTGIYFGPNWERVASKYPIDMANTYFADTYNIWGMKVGYKTSKGLSLFLEGKNITDEIYAASTGIVNNAAGLDTNAVFNPGNGRAWYGGVEWKW